jgi:NTE family protein
VRVGLILGAGGVQGGAWLTGGLDALAGETGWDPATADYIVGTSAGSMIGSLIAAGLPPWFMVAHSEGETFGGMTDARGEPAGEADRSAGAIFRPAKGAFPLFPGSLPLAVRSLLRPHRHTPAGVLSGWLPRGVISGEPLRDIIRRSVRSEWTTHPNHWVIACDYSTGRRVRFGREGAPRARLEDAVAASCAIPGFYQPVKIDGRRYVDGGIWSTSNLDVVRGLGLDLVVCLNPTSTLHPIGAANPIGAVRLLTNREAGRRLGREAKRLRAEGTEVVLIQPTHRDLEAMGLNLMAGSNRNEVIQVARETVAEQLEHPIAAGLLEQLPPGDPDMLRRPDRPSWEWPELDELAARVGPPQPATAGDG